MGHCNQIAANNMLRTQAIGHLGKDAEMKDVNGKKVINFSIGVSTGFGENKKTVWLECGKWGDNTQVAQFLTKGTQVHVDGEPSIRQWESNGKSGVSFQLNVSQITLVGGGKKDEGATQQPAAEQKAAWADTKVPEDDGSSEKLPF